MNTIFTIGIFLSLFLSILLFTKKGRTNADRLLAAWMIGISIHLLSYYIYLLGYWEIYPHLVGITHPFPLLHGPFLFLYVALSLRSKHEFKQKDFLHFLPFVLSYVYMIRFFFFYTAEQKIQEDQTEISDFYVFQILSLVAFVVSGVAYPIVAYRLAGRYNSLVTQNFAFKERISLKWLRYCILGIAAIFLTIGLVMFIKLVLGFDFGFNESFIFYSQIVIFVFFIGYFGIKHYDIFSGSPTQNQPIIEPQSPAEYKNSGLKPLEATQYLEQLLAIMDSKKLHLEPKLTLQKLADELGVSANIISQVINQHQGVNFFDFINTYRVNEAKIRLKEPKYKNYSIIAIAYDSGFSSKSTFNQAFKKITGKTPSQYLEEDVK